MMTGLTTAAAAFLVIFICSWSPVMARDGAALCANGGRCLDGIVAACSCAGNDAQFCESSCRSTWGSAESFDCLKLAENGTVAQAVLSLTVTCNAVALSPSAAPLDSASATGVEAGLACLGNVSLESGAVAACLGGAARDVCPPSCADLLAQIPLDCRVKVGNDSLYGGQFSALFSTCDVKGVSSAPEDALTSPEAPGPSGVADDEAPTLTPVNTPYVPEPPPSAAGRAAALHLWLQVAGGTALLLLCVAWR